MLLASSPADMPLTSVLSGSVINVTLQLLAHDQCGQQCVFGGMDPAPIFRAGSETLTLLGERTKTIFTGYNLFNPLVPPMVIEIAPCVAAMHLDMDPPVGPAYPVCVPLVCPQGCIHGTCTAASECTCDAGHKGISCQFPEDLSDTIELFISSPPCLATPAVRDALLVQGQVVLPPGYALLFRSMTAVRDTAGRSVVQFRFAVVNEMEQVAQADALVPVAAHMAEAIPFPEAKKTAFRGLVWPQSTEPTATDTDVPTTTMDGGLPMTSTDARNATSVAPIVPAGVSVQLDGGKTLLVLCRICLLVHLTSGTYLVAFRRQHRVVVTSNSWWVLLATAAVTKMHLAVGHVAGGMFVVVIETKGMHCALVYENGVLCEMHRFSTKSHRRPLTMFTAALTTIELAMVLAWPLNPETATTSAVSIPLTDGSYWHCTGTWQHSAGGAFMPLNTVVGLVAMWWIVKARNMLPPSHEPPMLIFAMTNIALMLAVLLALSSISGDAFVATTLASFGLLGSMVVAIHQHQARVGTTSQVHAPETIRAAPPAASVLVNTDLHMLEHAGTVTVALVPIRVRSKGPFAPWRLCEVEVATDYQLRPTTST
ncbi:hypothetical protein GGF31_005267 [Allomyces arbusculus]|nr:hypothetical protein GGF31_005267 [Allomyces arbusculus]